MRKLEYLLMVFANHISSTDLFPALCAASSKLPTAVPLLLSKGANFRLNHYEAVSVAIRNNTDELVLQTYAKAGAPVTSLVMGYLTEDHAMRQSAGVVYPEHLVAWVDFSNVEVLQDILWRCCSKHRFELAVALVSRMEQPLFNTDELLRFLYANNARSFGDHRQRVSRMVSALRRHAELFKLQLAVPVTASFDLEAVSILGPCCFSPSATVLSLDDLT